MQCELRASENDWYAIRKFESDSLVRISNCVGVKMTGMQFELRASENNWYAVRIACQSPSPSMLLILSFKLSERSASSRRGCS